MTEPPETATIIHRFLTVVGMDGDTGGPREVDEYETMEMFVWPAGWDEPTEARAEKTSPLRNGSTWIWAWGTDRSKVMAELETATAKSVAAKMRYRIMSRLGALAREYQSAADKLPRGWERVHQQEQADAVHEEWTAMYREVHGSEPPASKGQG